MMFTLHSTAVQNDRNRGMQPDCRAALLRPENEQG